MKNIVKAFILGLVVSAGTITQVSATGWQDTTCCTKQQTINACYTVAKLLGCMCVAFSALGHAQPAQITALCSIGFGVSGAALSLYETYENWRARRDQ